MTLPVFFAVLLAALLHAGWNAILKSGGDKIDSMYVMSTAQGLMGLGLVTISPLPSGAVWGWIIASVILHTFYKIFLAGAYGHGDLSRVYPIARGAPPMMVALFGAVILADSVSPSQYGGIFLVGLGILAMARGVFTGGESLRLLPFALGSALMTAGYTVVDGLGARVATSTAAYVAWMFFLDGVLFASWAVTIRGKPVLRYTARLWVQGLLAGAASYAAYAIVVRAMTQAPIALVAALRETSVLFAVLIGVLFFRERASPGKLVAAGLILSGVVLTRL